MAISITCLSLKYVLDKNFLKFALIVFLATSFHYSAVAFLLVYPISKIKFLKRNFYLMLSGGLLICVTLGLLLFVYARNSLFVKYAEWQDIDEYSAGKGYFLLTFYLLNALAIFYVYRHLKCRIHGRTTLFIEVSIFMFLLAFFSQLFATYMATFTRMSNYFFLPFVVVVPDLIYYFKSSVTKKIAISSVVLLLYFYMCLKIYAYVPTLNSNSQGVLPYKFLN